MDRRSADARMPEGITLAPRPLLGGLCRPLGDRLQLHELAGVVLDDEGTVLEADLGGRRQRARSRAAAVDFDVDDREIVALLRLRAGDTAPEVEDGLVGHDGEEASLVGGSFAGDT